SGPVRRARPPTWSRRSVRSAGSIQCRARAAAAHRNHPFALIETDRSRAPATFWTYLPAVNRELFDNSVRLQRRGQPYALGDVLRLHHPPTLFFGRRLRTPVEQRRVDVAWKDRAGSDAVPAFFRVERLRQTRQSELRRHIAHPGQVPRQASGIRIDVDYRAAAALAHVVEEGARAVEGTVQVSRHHVVPVFDRYLAERAAPYVGARGVDEDVDAAEARQHVARHPFHGLVIRDVAHERLARPGSRVAAAGNGLNERLEAAA